jgi:hypothetical protein
MFVHGIEVKNFTQVCLPTLTSTSESNHVGISDQSYRELSRGKKNCDDTEIEIGGEGG